MPEAKIISAQVSLTDEAFDPNRSGHYHLSIQTDGTDLCYAVFDTGNNKYLSLQLSDELPALEFKSVTCSVASPKFTLVPNALFDQEKRSSLLGFNHPVESSEKVHSDLLTGMDARNLFTIPLQLEEKIRGLYSNAHFLHDTTALIEGLMLLNKTNTKKKVFADLRKGHMTVVILDGRELVFSNSFSFTTPEEIAYYILFVYEQLRLNPDETELVLSGLIEKSAKEHELLFNYIRHVKFAKLPDSFKYSYKFDEVQSHKFFSLFNQYLCA